MRGYEKRLEDLEARVEELTPEQYDRVAFVCGCAAFEANKPCECRPAPGDVTVITPLVDDPGPPPAPPSPEFCAALRGTVAEVEVALKKLARRGDPAARRALGLE